MDWGVIFDLDGVLIDSSAAHRKSWEMLAVEEKLALPVNFFERSFGIRNAVIIPEIFAWTEDENEIRRLGDRKEHLYRELIAREGLDPLSGVPELMADLNAWEVPFAIGTSTPRTNVEVILPLLRLAHDFDGIVASEDCAKGKPDPEVFLKAAEKVGRKPERCVVIEDAPAGIEAALSGKMKAVGITTSHPPEILEQAGAHWIVRSMEEVSPARLQELFEA